MDMIVCVCVYMEILYMHVYKVYREATEKEREEEGEGEEGRERGERFSHQLMTSHTVS